MGKFAKDRRDIFYRKAKQEGWRARSAYKLLQLDEEFDLLHDKVTRAVDLCAAPGSWSQVLSAKLWKENEDKSDQPNQPARIVAVDLQEMSPIPGVRILKGDITSKETAEKVVESFGGGKAQLVVSDGAPDVTGLHDLDEFVQAQLLLAALNLATFLLEEDGTFVAKIFRGKDVTLLYAQFEIFFESVVVAKPLSSRISSAEAFIVCRGFHLPSGFVPSFENPIKALSYGAKSEPMVGPKRSIVKFVACGDIDGPDGYDPNRSYDLEKDATFKEPIHPPIHPSHELAAQKLREQHNNNN
jgi:tRNA (cytidine32/guanosine34-2'-O)-methyltransferase